MKPKFSLAHKDEQMMTLVKNTDQEILALWAIDCAKRVLPYFKKKYPQDKRPQLALKTLQTWLKTGVFKMSVIRKASLDAHAAAREVGEDNVPPVQQPALAVRQSPLRMSPDMPMVQLFMRNKLFLGQVNLLNQKLKLLRNKSGNTNTY